MKDYPKREMPMTQQRIYRIITSVFVTGLLAGCAVGPDFKRPLVPAVAAYTAAPLLSLTTSAPTELGESQRLVEGEPVNPQWWQEFGSARLDALIAEALQANPTLTSARATLRQAQERYSARSGSTLYP